MVESLQTKITSYLDTASDSEIWKSLLEGERDALEFLFQRYYDDLYHYGVKLTGRSDMADDHIQKLFLKIWQRRDQLDEVTAVKTYLWTVLRRSIIDTFRKKKTEQKYLDRFSNNQLQIDFSTEELIINEEQNTIQRKALKEAMDQLSARQREVLYLKFYEGMSYQEIEDIMCISYQACRNCTYRAIASLRKILHPEILASVILAGLLGIL